MIFDEQNNPVDFEYLEINDAFERLTGLKRDAVIGKKVTEAIPGTEKANPELFEIYGRVALTCREEKFEIFFKPLSKWFSISVYCPQKGYFAAIFEDISERKKAEQELWQAKKDWERTFDSIPDFVSLIDNQCRIMRVNQAMAQQLKVTPEKAIGLFCYQCVHGLNNSPDFCPHAQTMKDGKEHQAEVHEPRLGGDFLVTTTPLKDEQGRMVGSVHVTRNITERKQREHEIENLAKFPSENPNAVFRIDGKGTILYGNAAGASFLTAWGTAVGERSPEHIIQTVAEALASNRRVETEETYRDKVFSLLFAPVTLEGYVNVYANEITERKKAEIALRESEQRWATTLASIGDAVIATDVRGNITFMNGEAEELTGWTLSEASQKPVKKAFNIVNEQTRLEVENPIIRVLREGIVVGLANHTVLIRKDGKEVAIDDSGAPIIDKAGKISGVVLVFRDITERKMAEEKLEEYQTSLERLVEERTRQLKDSERLAAIGATAGMVGHDIRNPLQAIIGDVYLAKTELASIPESAEKKNTVESLEGIEKNIEYINKIVADLQDFARPLNPHAEVTDLKLIIEDLLRKNGLPANIKVTVKVEDDARKIMADSSYINRIMYNLVNNGVQAMPNGGKLTIRGFIEAKDVIITVKDTGVGIPDSVKSKLFTPMFTTKSKGQGFGLPVVKRMTEALGGTVTFKSKEGRGTTFIVRLPPHTSNRG